ncbi:MAG: type I-E CRISPR-associated protein Cas6/Cse3/CasE [Gemmatimonadaceae bacterium]
MNSHYLSRATIELRGRESPRGSSRSYLLHQAVADLIPDRSVRGYLFRETATRSGVVDVLFLSDTPPRPVREIPVRTWYRPACVDTKPYSPRLRAGLVLDFEIRLNATRVVTDAAGRKQRHDIWNAIFRQNRFDERSPDDVYSDYLRRKFEGAASLLSAHVTERGEIQAMRGQPLRAIRFVATNVIGTLEVTDGDRLRDLVVNGIGRARAFGCGLLCLSLPGTILPRRQTAGAPA